ncbi:MAG: JAB domain-containing protein [Candidatus Borkfalkiaceae bacterium]|nr:JAB domain-containing protein [Clostridia bacterium]MDY6223395.1 JAB domain-containing protein [Christensenellaceae bacterium]
MDDDGSTFTERFTDKRAEQKNDGLRGENSRRSKKIFNRLNGAAESGVLTKRSKHEGHRSRLIAKLDSGALDEHEWLEALLFNAQPRKDTNALAHDLLLSFGCIENIFSASMKQLTSVKGVGENIAAYLRCVGKFYEKYRRDGDCLFPKLYNAAEFIDYAVKEYAHKNIEVFDLYFMGERANFISRKRFEGLNEREVSIPASKIGEALILNKPYGLIVAHNHPNASCEPSETDNETTNAIQLICNTFGVLLCDHYIVGARKDVYSYYAAGKMTYINKNYSLEAILSTAKMYKNAMERQKHLSDKYFAAKKKIGMRTVADELYAPDEFLPF